jgi:DNA-binding beta-propeller fold protein YncE
MRAKVRTELGGSSFHLAGVVNRVETVGGKQMRAWGLGAVMLLAILVAGCGGNATAVGITITGPAPAPLTIIVNHPAQFAAAVTGATSTTVFWQICEPLATPSTTIPPTECTAPQGPVGCTMPTVKSPIVGFGTITVNGLYTAPATVPNPTSFVIVATSCIKANAFDTFMVTIDSGIRVDITPTSASIGPGEFFQFTATVSGTANTSVVWLVNNIPGGSATDGFICPSPNPPSPCGAGSAPGEYFAPLTSPGQVTVAAQSGADPTQQGSASVSIGSGSAPTFALADPMEPTVAAEGSVQQDVYLSGTGFLSTSRVFVGSVALPAANVKFINGGLLRATIPAAQLAQAGPVNVSVKSQSGALSSGTLPLQVDPVRPALIASTPDSVPLNNSGASLGVQLTGGYFVPNNKTTATFNGIGCGGGNQVCTSFVDSRHLNVAIQDTNLNSPGLYQLIVQNSDAATAGVPSISGLNLAVNPDPTTISGSPSVNLSVGATATPGPSAVAIDYADGIAVVANTRENSVSLINLITDTLITKAIAVGSMPTGVAVDDMLPHHMAYVVNSADNSISVIDLNASPPANVQTLLLNNFEPSVIPTGTVPFSIGANPLTHRAFVANQSTNVGTILDLANATGPACPGAPCPIGTITGGVTSFGTGPSPGVAIDPRLNWAMVTPGGAGTTAIVDLGRAPTAGDVGRLPELIGSVSISSTLQGIGINTETHQALLTDPEGASLTTFSLLNNTVTSVQFTVGGVALNALNYGSAGVTPFENLGIAVQESTSGAGAVVADLESGVVLKQIGGLGKLPVAVAVDPASNQAVIVNRTDGNVSIVSLGPTLTPPQILEASPATTFTSGNSLQLTVTGANFTPGSMVRLDQTPLVTSAVASSCTTTCRQLTATVPAAMLGVARRYLVDVVNTNGSVSDVTDLAVIQAVPVGNAPVGVAVDTDRDLAVVTNSLDDTVSLVSLAAPSTSFSPESLGPTGTVGMPIPVGTTPEGIAVDPLLGVAFAANNGSNNVTAIDLTTIPVTPISPAAVCSGCTGPVGVAVNQDTATAAVTTTNSANVFTTGNVSFFSVVRSPMETPQIATTLGASPAVDQNPVAVAMDPTLNFAAVATASGTSALDVIDLATDSIAGRVSGLQDPSGVLFDPVNQVFLTVNSLLNNIIITNPATLTSTTAQVGIAPTSIDYNFQTSSLVTVNSGSHTMSVLDYTCPPSIVAPQCFNPQVRSVIDVGGAQSTTFVLGPNAVAIDPKLNLAVLVDPDNNRVLLVPLPH